MASEHKHTYVRVLIINEDSELSWTSLYSTVFCCLFPIAGTRMQWRYFRLALHFVRGISNFTHSVLMTWKSRLVSVAACSLRIDFPFSRNVLITSSTHQITHCGVCHSDLHTVDGDWGPQPYPVVPGHEIIGFVTQVGPAVKDIKVGMRVGVGPQALSCRSCHFCNDGQETFCEKGFIGTYCAKLEDGYITKGGYALYHRTDAHFAIPIPENLDSAKTAPLLCAAVTVYTPLRHSNVKPGVRVAVIGIGMSDSAVVACVGDVEQEGSLPLDVERERWGRAGGATTLLTHNLACRWPGSYGSPVGSRYGRRGYCYLLIARQGIVSG